MADDEGMSSLAEAVKLLEQASLDILRMYKSLEDGDGEARGEIEEDAVAPMGKALGKQLDAALGGETPDAGRIEDGTEEVRAAGEELLGEAALLGVQAARMQVGDTPTIGVEWDGVNEAALAWARSYSYELVRGLNETSLTLLQQEIGDWIERGGTLEELRTRLAPHFGEERARSIAATEVTRAYAEGNLEAWRATGLVSGKEWRTAKDDRVCPICGPLHGELVALEGEFEGGWRVPPAHVRCRCWLVPVMRKG